MIKIKWIDGTKSHTQHAIVTSAGSFDSRFVGKEGLFEWRKRRERARTREGKKKRKTKNKPGLKMSVGGARYNNVPGMGGGEEEEKQANQASERSESPRNTFETNLRRKK